VADVVGHGDTVAAVSGETYGQLRQSVDIVDDRRVLREHADSCEALLDRLLAALLAHTGRDRLVHDDVTVFVGEFVDGPRGPALWHVLKNRLRLGRVQVGAIRRRQDPAAGPATP
jgi:hypothetical protein